MRHMYGVELQVPAGKLPGFYAQVIHKIGDHVNVFDRDKLLFIVENEEECEKLEAILTKSSMLGDILPLLQLPSSTQLKQLDDFGFVSQNEHLYVYAERVALFTITTGAGSEQDRWAASEQLQEHLLGTIPQTADEAPVCLIDSSLTELADGIARAYQTSLTWLYRES
ncbi:hypothetical protein [Brevibacillus reuszeri]|uniref:hypothetical protein n=1 Tax=Brevibacillus reuszeri TaxID=54915 RepID=UPI000CCC6AAC|nr:hypothetical protein [Brevibacillus reuszeri]